MIYSFVINERSDFYELWQQHKQLKTMDMNEDLPDTYNEEYIHQFQPGPTHKIQYQQHKHHVYINLSMEHLSKKTIKKTVPISTRIVISCAIIRGILF